MSHVLIIDDEPSICWGFKEFLTEDGHDVSTVASAEEGLEAARKTRPDAVVLDIRLPGMDGLTAIGKLREIIGDTPIIVITAFGNLETAVQAVREGAFDYLPKPFDLGRAAELVGRALKAVNAKKTREKTVDDSPFEHETLIGTSPAMQEVFKQIALVSGVDVPVLITGESGTGKELVARAIHTHGSRSQEPFVPVCLPALSSGVVESELFGHVKGAFTGADSNRTGLLELAGQGTVLLDEVADSELSLQVKLLRALEQREVTPVGDARPRPISARLIAATNRDLSLEITEGRFREDLYFRLSVFQIHLPPLRERTDDIPILVRHFLRLLGHDISDTDPSPDVLQQLAKREWAGNIRELRNVIERAVIVSRGQPIRAEVLPAPMASLKKNGGSSNAALEKNIADWVEKETASYTSEENVETTLKNDLHERFLSTVEPPFLREALRQCDYNRAAAAQLLGIHRTTLRQKLRKYGIE